MTETTQRGPDQASIITRSNGETFKTEAAAKTALGKMGLTASHRIVPAASRIPAAEGWVITPKPSAPTRGPVLRQPAATPPPPSEPPTPPPQGLMVTPPPQDDLTHLQPQSANLQRPPREDGNLPPVSTPDALAAHMALGDSLGRDTIAAGIRSTRPQEPTIIEKQAPLVPSDDKSAYVLCPVCKQRTNDKRIDEKCDGKILKDGQWQACPGYFGVDPTPKVERYIRVVFAQRAGENDFERVELTVNGHTLTIARGVQVTIPERYVECARNAIRTAWVKYPGEPRKRAVPLQMFPYSILGVGTPEEYTSAKRQGTRDTLQQNNIPMVTTD